MGASSPSFPPHPSSNPVPPIPFLAPVFLETLVRRDLYASRFSRSWESVALHSRPELEASRCYLAKPSSRSSCAGMPSSWADPHPGHHPSPAIGPWGAQLPLRPNRQPVWFSPAPTSNDKIAQSFFALRAPSVLRAVRRVSLTLRPQTRRFEDKVFDSALCVGLTFRCGPRLSASCFVNDPPGSETRATGRHPRPLHTLRAPTPCENCQLLGSRLNFRVGSFLSAPPSESRLFLFSLYFECCAPILPVSVLLVAKSRCWSSAARVTRGRFGAPGFVSICSTSRHSLAICRHYRFWTSVNRAPASRVAWTATVNTFVKSAN